MDVYKIKLIHALKVDEIKNNSVCYAIMMHGKKIV